jgi:Ricin-type beta-trefoil lectin domain-like
MNPVRRILAPALGAALLVGLAAPSASADYFPPGFPNGIPPKVLMLQNVHSDKCLEIGGWSTANGAGANLWDTHGGDNQRWWTIER